MNDDEFPGEREIETENDVVSLGVLRQAIGIVSCDESPEVLVMEIVQYGGYSHEQMIETLSAHAFPHEPESESANDDDGCPDELGIESVSGACCPEMICDG
jgi:hypothetical protein